MAISSGASATLGSSETDSSDGKFAIDSISILPESAKELSEFSSQLPLGIDAIAVGPSCSD